MTSFESSTMNFLQDNKFVLFVLGIGAVLVIGFFIFSSHTASNSLSTTPIDLQTLGSKTATTESSQTESGRSLQPETKKTATDEATHKNTITTMQSKPTFNAPPPMTIDKNKSYGALLKTSKGDVTIELSAKETPITVNNFVFLAKKQFYDNTIFHRVIKGFMIQGGDPKGDGTGGPGYRFSDEPFSGGYDRGVVAMANSGPNTNGSQFFIMHQKSPLPKNYVIFGRVISGMDVVDKIAESEVQRSSSGELSNPIAPVSVTSVEIKEN